MAANNRPQLGSLANSAVFTSGECATVNATPGVECLVFECDALRDAMATNPDLERGVSNALNANLATKLIRNNETHTVV